MSTFGQPDFNKPVISGVESGPGPAFGSVQPGGVFVFGRPGRLDSEEALRSYLLARAIGRSVRNTVLWTGLLVLALAVVAWLAGFTVLAVLVGLVGLALLLARAAVVSLGRRLGRGPADPQVDRLVARTGRGLRTELRRVGLPGAPWAPLLLAFRLVRRRHRARTVQALSRVELARVVPAGQVDELHLLLQTRRGSHPVT